MTSQGSDYQPWTTSVPEDLRNHLALVDCFLRQGRAAGVCLSIGLLLLSRGRFDSATFWYSATALAYLIWQALNPPERGAPHPTRLQHFTMAGEFY